TVGVLFFTLDGTIADANPAFERMSGYTRDELLRTTHWEAITRPEHMAATVRAAAELADRGETEPYEKEMVRKDGSRWWGLFAPTRLSGTGRDSRCVEFVIDVTARREAEEALRASDARNRFLLDLEAATRPLTDPAAIMAAATRLLGEHLGATRIAYADVEPDNDRFTIRDDWRAAGVKSTAGTYSLGAFGPRAAADMRAGRTLVVRDVDAELAPADGAETFNAIGIKGIVCCPLVKGGRLVAMMAAHQAAPRGWAADEVALVEAVVERSWAHVERVRAEAAVRERDERLQLFLGNATDYAVIISDPQDRAVEWLGGAERITGWPADEALGQPVEVIFTPEDRAAGVPGRETARAAATGRAENVRWHQRKDGSRFFAEGVTVSLRGPGGELRGFGKVFRDATEQRRAEAALRQSEERHRALVTATSDVAYRMSADWEVMHPLDGRGRVASNAEAIRGWMEKNLPASEHPRVRDAIRRAVETKGTFELEHRVNRPDGTTGWTFSRAVPILDAAGDITEWFGTARDVTERRAAEERLQRSHDTFLNLIQNNPFGVYLVDADFRLARVSLGAQKVFAGVRPLLGRDFDEVLRTIWAEPAAAEFAGHFRRTLATGEPYVSVDTTARRADVDAVESYDWRIERVPLPDGRHGVVCYFYDMTERRRIEDALKDADRKKDDFIALLAHELRNPLAPIRNGLQVIRLAEDRATRDRSQKMMDRQLAHMVRMIDDLLDVSRIGRNKMELRRARVALADVVGSAVETARPAIEEAGHELTVALPEQPVYLDADLTRLSQVLSNLLTNSAKYTERGGKVWLWAEPRAGEVVVAVRDTGIGIPADAIPNIFDMFSQVDRPTERSTVGLGIGLALVKGLVEMHGGTVSACSDGPGRGSEFTVTLPVIAVESTAAALVPEDRPAGTRSRRRVLVVDDNRDGAETMAVMLGMLGDEVRTAHDGVEAVEQAERFRPAVILMDLGMPRLSGLDATRQIRAQPWGREMTIIALTGWGQEADRERTRAAGCNGHLVKPVDLSELEKLMDEVMR
ncbi:MAG TPA: PAS domain S-box protein, partial [Urbifossiella sp.]|nr:PAS domain S-box protein [Urbifossiella sp.]